jgi:hypothetical protein
MTEMTRTEHVNKNHEEEDKDNQQLMGIVRPRENDVLCGRGGLANNYCG